MRTLLVFRLQHPYVPPARRRCTAQKGYSPTYLIGWYKTRRLKSASRRIVNPRGNSYFARFRPGAAQIRVLRCTSLHESILRSGVPLRNQTAPAPEKKAPNKINVCGDALTQLPERGRVASWLGSYISGPAPIAAVNCEPRTPVLPSPNERTRNGTK